jgi:hypothetical protein
VETITDRLKYISEDNTQSYISSETGIPQSTLSYVIRGERNLPLQYYDAVNSLYSREVSKRLIDLGAPEHQANRFLAASVSTVKEKELFVAKIADGITQQNLIERAAIDDIPTSRIESFFLDNWYETHDNIVNSMRLSEKPLEEWAEKYPSAL